MAADKVSHVPMRLSPGYTKLSQKDVYDLNTASECIAGAANTIHQLRPQWGPAVVALLVQANDICMRIQNRGAGAIARYIEKQNARRLPAPADPAGTSETVSVSESAQTEVE